ncbi:MAG: hypothetical protein L0H59_14020 [Tomitella sp.]|nr:hypothetical protein [Tomitella sp.]
MSAPWIAVVLAMVIVVIVMAVALIGIYTQVSAAMTRVEALLGRMTLDETFRGLSVATVAPPLRRSLDSPGAREDALMPDTARPQLVVFADAGCAPCANLIEEIRMSSADFSGVEAVVVTKRRADDPLPPLPTPWEVIRQDGSVSRDFNISAVPYAYAIAADRMIVASGIPNTVADLQMMMLRLAPAARSDLQAIGLVGVSDDAHTAHIDSGGGATR